MGIGISGYTPASLQTAANAASATRTKSSAADGAAPESALADKVTLQNPSQTGNPATYADPRTGVAQTGQDLQSLLDESNRKAQQIIDLIVPMIKQQGLNLAKVVSGEQKLTVDPETIEKAKAAIADDGEFGVKQVAERILSFAKAAIGNDPSRLEAIRAAVEKGFKDAADVLGGALPDISQKTHEAIMAEFDRWQSEGIPADGAVSLGGKNDTSEAERS